jgi:hypothetical protein
MPSTTESRTVGGTLIPTREQLHRLVDDLPTRELWAATRFLEFLRADQHRHDLPPELANAPLDDEPETPEEAAAGAEAWEDVAAGRVFSLAALLQARDFRRRVFGDQVLPDSPAELIEESRRERTDELS